jgi:hypothetical protein
LRRLPRFIDPPSLGRIMPRGRSPHVVKPNRKEETKETAKKEETASHRKKPKKIHEEKP